MTVPSGKQRHRVTLANPGDPVPDGDGGFTAVWTALTPAVAWAEIKPATTRDLERLAAGTVIATASHIVTLHYHPEVTTQTRLTFGARQLSVVGVANPAEKNVELILTCVEVVL